MKESGSTSSEGICYSMKSKATTLGGFIAELMQKHEHSNRSLAAAAGVSEGAVRNILKYGIETDARDPDARTIRLVADALDADVLVLFRLAGYIPPPPPANSIRAEFLADVFDELPPEKQDAVFSVVEAMSEKRPRKESIRVMRDDSHPLAGFDLHAPHIVRIMANQLIVQCEMTEPADISRIQDDAEVYQYKWRDLPPDTQVRVKALIQHKLSLDYDPVMVDPEWRK